MDKHDRVERFMASIYSRSMLPYLVTGALLVISIVVAGREIEHHINAIELWMVNLGPWSMLAFIGLFVLATSCLLPESVPAIIAGALFGVTRGFAVIIAANLLASALQFLIALHLLRTQILRVLAARPSLAAILRAVFRDAFRLQVLLRLTPLNPALISYLLGAAGVRFPGFLIACLALAPNLLMEVYFGNAGKHIAQMAARNARVDYLHESVVIGSFAVCVIVVVLVSRMARKAVLDAVAETENTEKQDRSQPR